MKLSELKLNERNPRQIKGAAFEKLKKSVKELPKMMRLRPIVIDTDGVILGGNMRFRALQALGYSEIPNEWVKVADDLTEEEKQRFIIEDNVQFGEWDFDMLFNEWDTPSLEDWGVDLPVMDENYSDTFLLENKEKEPFEQMSFCLSTEQAELVRTAVKEAKEKEDFSNLESFGNTNSNGNALYYILQQWLMSSR